VEPRSPLRPARRDRRARPRRTLRLHTRASTLTLALVTATMLVTVWATDQSPAPSHALSVANVSPSADVVLLANHTRHTAHTAYPIGTRNPRFPSGEAPPSATALAGYHRTYVARFSGTSLPAGWMTFRGTPSGDNGSQWLSSHVVVSNGLLNLNAYEDPQAGNQWVTGGVCQCGLSSTYGAYFVRSRMTGPGPTQVEMLWPTSGWPPEIDFNETFGSTSTSLATVHYGSSNSQVHRSVAIDMTQWHTWGVVWTATSIVYVVDGRAWGVVTTPAAIPNQPMALHIQQQTWCGQGFACPTTSASTEVAWVAEYASTN